MTILFLASLLTVLTVIIHSFGTYVVIAQRLSLPYRSSLRPWIRMVGTMAFVVTFLLMTHLAEALIWAIAYHGWHVFPDFGTSAYYSLTSYSTVGFGDVVLPPPYRLLGPIESVVGVLMLGWSTAVIVAIVQNIYQETLLSSKKR